MSDLLPATTAAKTLQGAHLAKGGLAFFGGMLVCGTALLLQAAVLHAVSSRNK